MKKASTIRPFEGPRLMTEEAFRRWALANQIRPLWPPPCRLVACACSDLNCHGWRFVAERSN
jgi:hypothetical protein